MLVKREKQIYQYKYSFSITATLVLCSKNYISDQFIMNDDHRLAIYAIGVRNEPCLTPPLMT